MELFRGDRDVVLVGHRGAAALGPENSLAAIEAAAANGVDAVELDAARGPGGTLVLAHGPRLGLDVLVDVKEAGVETGVVEALRQSGLRERSFVSSASLRSLRAFAVLEPRLPRSLTYPEDRFGISERRALAPAVRPSVAVLHTLLTVRLPRLLRASGVKAVTLNSGVVTRRAVEICHRASVAVYVWTVNDPVLAKTLVERGVDGIITDDPRLLRRETRPTS